jgi:hypothetical protein
MKRIGVTSLVTSAVLSATFVAASGSPVAQDPPRVSRAATFVGLKDRDTIFVERVFDAPGGFRGEVSLPGGGAWIRYRVELGPDETMRRYELDLAQRPGDVPRPALVTRRGRDSVFIEPRPGAPFPAVRLAVPPAAIIASTEMAMFELAIRYGLSLGGTHAAFPMFSAWTGKRFDAAVTSVGLDKVRLRTVDTWEFTLDQQRRIVSGTRIGVGGAQANDPWAGIRVVRQGAPQAPSVDR